MENQSRDNGCALSDGAEPICRHNGGWAEHAGLSMHIVVMKNLYIDEN
jgi:hypothetical protein